MRNLLFICLFLTTHAFASEDTNRSTAPLSQAAMVELLKELDDRQKNGGDYRMMAYLEQKQAGKDTIAYEMTIYRRDELDQLMMLFQAKA